MYRIYDKEIKEYDSDLVLMSNGEVLQMCIEFDEYGFEQNILYDELYQKRFIIEKATGIKDINGKEIYVGDIVEQDGFIGEVTFYEGQFWIEEKDEGFKLIDYSTQPCKIIGNIHESQ